MVSNKWLVACGLWLVALFAPTVADAQTCRYTRVVTETGDAKGGAPLLLGYVPATVSTVVGGDAWGIDASRGSSTEVLIGLDTFQVPINAQISSVRLWGSHDATTTNAMTFRLVYALGASEAQTNLATWASSPGTPPAGWASPALGHTYRPDLFTYWITVNIPIPSPFTPTGLFNVHTARVCWS